MIDPDMEGRIAAQANQIVGAARMECMKRLARHFEGADYTPPLLRGEALPPVSERIPPIAGAGHRGMRR